MTNETITVSEAFECVLHVVDRFDQKLAVAGDSCAEYTLERCQSLICAERLAVLTNPRAYLALSARRVCIRYFRRKRKIKLVLQPNGTADNTITSEQDPCQIVWDALASLHDELTDRERICAESLATGVSKKRIAERLGVSSSYLSKLTKQVQLKIKQRITDGDAIY